LPDRVEMRIADQVNNRFSHMRCGVCLSMRDAGSALFR
jgi:hypothetical protein